MASEANMIITYLVPEKQGKDFWFVLQLLTLLMFSDFDNVMFHFLVDRVLA